MMTSAQVVDVTTNSSSQDYTHPEDHNLPTYDMTPTSVKQATSDDYDNNSDSTTPLQGSRPCSGRTSS